MKALEPEIESCIQYMVGLFGLKVLSEVAEDKLHLLAEKDGGS